jgi:glyoxylase-like metal-dependent hydrolase (beta-lactamase superfamily II)
MAWFWSTPGWGPRTTPTSRPGWGSPSRVYGRPALDPSLAAIRQVEKLGFAVSDVRQIVQTHLDHVGGLSDFPEARVHVHATELDAAMARRGIKARDRYRPRMWAHHPDFPGSPADARGDQSPPRT